MSMISACVENQRKYFNSNVTRPLQFRLEQLQKLKEIVILNQQKVIEALALDLKKSEMESFVSEISLVLEEINFSMKHLRKWYKPQKVSTPLSLKPSQAKIISEPFGVTLIISPWNYPFQLAISPLVGAIAAGNTAILKPSEISSHTEKLLSEMINSMFAPEYIHVLTGGKDVAEELLKQKLDFIFFTGSTAVGKIIMKKAAENLTPVCLELGGKSPAIIDESANLNVAARRIVWGKFYNAGQTCVAPDYLYVHESIKTTFIGLLKKNIRNFYGENEAKSNDYGKIISKSHFDRLENILTQSKILYGGDKNRDEQFISPTLIEASGWEDEAMKDEIFGPLLPILSYKNFDDVIHTLKSKDKPLALYMFSTHDIRTQKVLSELSFGGGCVNDCLIHLGSLKLPFGGVGTSGMGKYHGKYSFDTFSHQKSIILKSNFLDLDLRYPPYTESKLKIIKKILKT